LDSQWFVYLLRCNDNSLYAGVTTDLQRRVDEHNHNNKIGAKYTRVRRPVSLIYYETMPSRSKACQREYQLKQLSKQQKERLISTSTIKN
jgi:putative endonuclease